MRTADALCHNSLIIMWICLAQQHFWGILIDRILCTDAAEIRQAEQTENIGVVHQIVMTHAVHLVGIHVAILIIVHDCVLLKSLLDLVAQLPDAPFKNFVGASAEIISASCSRDFTASVINITYSETRVNINIIFIMSNIT